MRCVFRPEPKPPAVYSNLNMRSDPKVPGGISQFECEAFFDQDPKFLAEFPSLSARRFSVRTQIPGDIFQFKCDVVLGQNRNSWQYFPV